MKLAVLLVLLSLRSLAQCPPVELGTVAEFFGVVRASGQSVAGAKLSVEPDNGKRPPTATTLSQDGHFRFVRLPPGKYVVVLHRKGVPDNHYSIQIAPRAKHAPVEITLGIAGVC